jgi:hypothetical protein
MNKLLLTFIMGFCSIVLFAQKTVPVKPRILISTDIGGTDPDDNQSLAHLLMYSDKFKIEGLVSSPSFGNGNKEEIFRMISLYEQDLPKLKEHQKGLLEPEYLRSVTKQGRSGRAPFIGYSTATEGSEWIIKCAKQKTDQPLWVLGWGGLEDIAQALHDAPEIQKNIRVYWIGGPNKKWSANSYDYIAKNFPDLWFIEVNSSYYGFFSKSNIPESVSTRNYYDKHIHEAGNLGKDFKSYYDGKVKMGDTPSLLYMLDGDPTNPMRESWGGSFDRTDRSSRVIFSRPTTLKDTVAFCTMVEFNFMGPDSNIPADSICFWMETVYKSSVQKWPGYYLGNGIYGLKYVPKQAEVINYRFQSTIPDLTIAEGKLVVINQWPDKARSSDYKLGSNWYTDKSDERLYDGKIQGGKTISKWREAILADWAKRWSWLK